MRRRFVFTFVLSLIILQMERESVVFARRRKPPGMRRIQNSRTRFQQRINRLGPKKIDLIRSGRLGKNRGLPHGFQLINGIVLDMSNKVTQKMIQGGTAYYTYQDKLGRRPLYIRPGNELGWHFVVFQDPFFWRGSGHLILLKKLLGVNINRARSQHDTLYEAYTLSLRVSMHPRVHLRDPMYRRKLRKRLQKVKKVKMQRQKFRKVGGNPHLRNRLGKLGKRKKRDVPRFTVASLNRGDCIIKRLNVTKVLMQIQRGIDKKNGNEMYNNSWASQPQKYHRVLHAKPINITRGV